jgi:hypothetical protein
MGSLFFFLHSTYRDRLFCFNICLFVSKKKKKHETIIEITADDFILFYLFIDRNKDQRGVPLFRRVCEMMRNN